MPRMCSYMAGWLRRDGMDRMAMDGVIRAHDCRIYARRRQPFIDIGPRANSHRVRRPHLRGRRVAFLGRQECLPHRNRSERTASMATTPMKSVTQLRAALEGFAARHAAMRVAGGIAPREVLARFRRLLKAAAAGNYRRF